MTMIKLIGHLSICYEIKFIKAKQRYVHTSVRDNEGKNV